MKEMSMLLDTKARAETFPFSLKTKKSASLHQEEVNINDFSLTLINSHIKKYETNLPLKEFFFEGYTIN